MIRENSYTDEVVAKQMVIERDGGPLPAYCATPRNATAETRSIVMAMHITGIDSQQRDTARRFASEGFTTVIPDLYAGSGAPDGDIESDYRAFLAFAKQLTFETVDPAILATSDWLRANHPRTGTAIVGFCMGRHHGSPKSARLRRRLRRRRNMVRKRERH
jgi:dienelactone hydrolase